MSSPAPPLSPSAATRRTIVAATVVLLLLAFPDVHMLSHPLRPICFESLRVTLATVAPIRSGTQALCERLDRWRETPAEPAAARSSVTVISSPAAPLPAAAASPPS